MKRRSLLFSGLAAGLAHAQTPGVALRLGLAPYLSPAALLALFRPVVEHLEKRLAQPVEAYTARDFQALGRSVRAGEYEIALLPAHLGRIALADWRWQPLARTVESTAALLLVRGDGKVRTLADLRGQLVGTLDLLSLTSAVAARWLAAQGMADVAIQPMPSINSALIALEREELGAVVATGSQVQALPPGTPAGQRTLARLDDVPGPVYVARPDAAPAALARWREALTSFLPDPARPRTAANTRPVSLALTDLDAMEPYAAYLRRQLEPR